MWRIRKAQEGDAAACRALLPDLFSRVGYAPQLLAAVDDSGSVIGAAGLAWAVGGFPFVMKVEPAWRGQGVGRALLEAAVDRARGETHVLRTAALIDADGAGAAFLGAHGFAETRRFLRFETEGAQPAADLGALLARMRGPRPVVVPMRQAPLDKAVALLAAAFEAAPFAVARRLTPGAFDGYDMDLSLAALEGNRVVGAMACIRRDGWLEIDLNATAPDRRRGVTNLALLEAVARLSVEAGLSRYVYACEPHVRDTLNIARRWPSARLPDRILMSRPLAVAS